jgi:hypothetical protein
VGSRLRLQLRLLLHIASTTAPHLAISAAMHWQLHWCSSWCIVGCIASRHSHCLQYHMLLCLRLQARHLRHLLCHLCLLDHHLLLWCVRHLHALAAGCKLLLRALWCQVPLLLLLLQHGSRLLPGLPRLLCLWLHVPLLELLLLLLRRDLHCSCQLVQLSQDAAADWQRHLLPHNALPTTRLPHHGGPVGRALPVTGRWGRPCRGISRQCTLLLCVLLRQLLLVDVGRNILGVVRLGRVCLLLLLLCLHKHARLDLMILLLLLLCWLLLAVCNKLCRKALLQMLLLLLVVLLLLLLLLLLLVLHAQP